MSVEKSYTIKKKTSNFTQIHNQILQKLKNYEALGFYCYIFSLPAEWKFYKHQLATHAGIGREKLNKLLRILKSHGLINIEQVRDDKGRFSSFVMHVNDVDEFKEYPDDIENPPLTEKPLTANRDTVNSSYKEYIYKYVKSRERESSQNHSIPVPEKTNPEKIKKSFCPGVHELFVSSKAIEIAEKKNLDIVKVGDAFMSYAKSNGWLRADWHEAFVKWLLDEKPLSKNRDKSIFMGKEETVVRPKYRDFTQERLDREAREKAGLPKLNS